MALPYNTMFGLKNLPHCLKWKSNEFSSRWFNMKNIKIESHLTPYFSNSFSDVDITWKTELKTTNETVLNLAAVIYKNLTKVTADSHDNQRYFFD